MGIIRLFCAHPPIQPWVYPEAMGAFHLLLEGEGRDEGGLKTIMPAALCVATEFFKTLYGRHILTRSTKIEMHPRRGGSWFVPGIGGNPHVIK